MIPTYTHMIQSEYNYFMQKCVDEEYEEVSKGCITKHGVENDNVERQARETENNSEGNKEDESQLSQSF